MTKEEAISILYQATDNIPLNREEHRMVTEALNVLNDSTALKGSTRKAAK